VRNQHAYLDIHAWCFVPHSFRLLIEDLHSLKLISLREIEFQDTIGHEFFITLSKNGLGHNKSRVEVSLQVEIELGK